MNKEKQKFGFTQRDAYDVSQRSLSFDARSQSGGHRDSARSSSYSSEPPSRAVVKRVKLR